MIRESFLVPDYTRLFLSNTTSIEARFTGYERLQDPHSEDGSGYKMPEMVSRTGNLDYGSFTLPAKSEMGKSTGLPVPLAKEDWGRATSVPPDFQRPERYGPPGKAKKRNQSNTKLAALPFTAHKDVYDTARWVGKEWVHPKGPGAPYVSFLPSLRLCGGHSRRVPYLHPHH